MMFSAAMVGVLVTMLLALVAAVRGPTVYDRILAVNMFGTKTVLLIAVLGALSASALDRLATAQAMTQDEYWGLLAERERVRLAYAALAEHGDVCLTLAASGAAPTGLASTGDPTFLVQCSLLGTPAVSLPVMQAEGLPLGLQLIGFVDQDAAMLAIARGILSLFDGG